MIISANGKHIEVNSVISETIKSGTKKYPALRFEFAENISSEDIAALMCGTFDILDDDGNVLGTHEGYNTRGSLSVVIGKITPVEKELEAVELELNKEKEVNRTLNNEVDVLNKTVDDLLLEVLGV